MRCPVTRQIKPAHANQTPSPSSLRAMMEECRLCIADIRAGIGVMRRPCRPVTRQIKPAEVEAWLMDVRSLPKSRAEAIVPFLCGGMIGLVIGLFFYLVW